MTATLVRVPFALLFLMFAACGGGGGGSGGAGSPGNATATNGAYSISLSSPSVALKGFENHLITEQTVTATFKGDGVVVGTLPGQSMPAWLMLSSPSVNGSEAQFKIGAFTSGLTAGTYSTTLRFVTGRADGSSTVYKDLSVTLELAEAFAVTPNELAFTVVEGTDISAPASTTLSTRGANVSWTAKAPSFLTLTPQTGAAQQTITVKASAVGMKVGQYREYISFTDANSDQGASVYVVMNVMMPDVTVSDSDLQFSITPQTVAADLQKTITISDTALGQNAERIMNWTLHSSSPLIKLSTESGTTASNTPVTVSLDMAQLNGKRSGTYSVPLTLSYLQPGSAYPTAHYIQTNVTVRMPELESAAPFAVASGAPKSVHLIGADLRDEDLASIRINGNSAASMGASIARLSSQELVLSLPSIASGTYKVTTANGLGLDRSAAWIRAYPSVTPAAGEIVATGARHRLIYDEIRNRLYGIDVSEHQIERYRWNGSAWVEVGSIAIPYLFDATLMRDGQHLMATGTGGYYLVDLDNDAANFALFTDPDYASCASSRAAYIATTEAATAFVSGLGFACSSYSEVNEYDLISMNGGNIFNANPDPNTRLYSPMANLESTRDGRYLVMGSTQDSGGQYNLLDMRTRTTVNFGDELDFGVYYHLRININDAGTRVLINNDVLRSEAGVTLGHLPSNVAAQLSHDGTKAYTFVRNSDGTGHIETLDLSQPVGGGNTFPKVGGDIAVNNDMGDVGSSVYGNVTDFGMTLDADDKTLFLSGTSRIVAIHLP